MKSLEIVNDKIAELKDTYQHYTAVEKDKAKSSFAKFDIEQFQQIKQDLEILEIIRKNLKFKEASYTEFTPPHNAISMNMIEFIGQTNEEFNKVKQWFEKEEN